MHLLSKLIVILLKNRRSSQTLEGDKTVHRGVYCDGGTHGVRTFFIHVSTWKVANTATYSKMLIPYLFEPTFFGLTGRGL